MDFDRVFDNLLVGTRPESRDDVDRLAEAGVTAVLCLLTDEDLQHLSVDWETLAEQYRSNAFEVVRIPVRDFDEEDLCRKLPECVEALKRLLNEEHTVYLHCNVGVGRSPSVTIAYLAWERGLKLSEAERHVRSLRACSPSMQAIRKADEQRGGV